jgi:hypothetical protein
VEGFRGIIKVEKQWCKLFFLSRKKAENDTQEAGSADIRSRKEGPVQRTS